MKKMISLMLLILSGFASAVTLHNVVAFGDSLSDNGNLYEYMQHQLPASPPYFEGRFADGPVWVERLVNSYFPDATSEHLLDYAFGGAGISEDPEIEALFTLKHEIDGYLLSHQDKADPNSFFVVWMGANNYLASPEDEDHAITEVIDGLTHSLQRLADAGAKHILVFNLPDLGVTPYAKYAGQEEILTRLSVRHNAQLQDTFEQLKSKNPAVRWFYYDVYSMLNDALVNPDKYGFNNIDGTCYETYAFKPRMNNHSMVRVASEINLKSKQPNCDGYLFFDLVHPAALAHKIIAGDVRAMLDREGIEFKS